jgi:thiol-disulfide isomerase/thioredoxin
LFSFCKILFGSSFVCSPACNPTNKLAHLLPASSFVEYTRSHIKRTQVFVSMPWSTIAVAVIAAFLSSVSTTSAFAVVNTHAAGRSCSSERVSFSAAAPTITSAGTTSARTTTTSALQYSSSSETDGLTEPLVSMTDSRPVIEEIVSVDQFQNMLAQNAEAITMVKFYATWCKSCQRFGLSYTRTARVEAETIKDGRLHMAAVEWGANNDLCAELGITKLPTVQFYYQGRRLTSFPCAPSKYYQLDDALEHYKNLSADDLVLEADLEQGGEMLASLSSQLTGSEKVLSSAM